MLPFLIGFSLCIICAGSHSCSEFLSTQWSYNVQMILFQSTLPYLWILQSFCPLFCDVPWALRGRVYNTDVEFIPEYSQTFFSLLFKHLRVSALMTIHCTKKFLWWRLRAELIYRHKNKYLEGNLVLFLFKKVMVVGPSLGLCVPRPWVVGPINNARHEVSSYGMGLKFNQKLLGDPGNTHATITLRACA